MTQLRKERKGRRIPQHKSPVGWCKIAQVRQSYEWFCHFNLPENLQESAVTDLFTKLFSLPFFLFPLTQAQSQVKRQIYGLFCEACSKHAPLTLALCLHVFHSHSRSFYSFWHAIFYHLYLYLYILNPSISLSLSLAFMCGWSLWSIIHVFPTVSPELPNPSPFFSSSITIKEERVSGSCRNNSRELSTF